MERLIPLSHQLLLLKWFFNGVSVRWKTFGENPSSFLLIFLPFFPLYMWILVRTGDWFLLKSHHKMFQHKVTISCPAGLSYLCAFLAAETCCWKGVLSCTSAGLALPFSQRWFVENVWKKKSCSVFHTTHLMSCKSHRLWCCINNNTNLHCSQEKYRCKGAVFVRSLIFFK